MMKSSTNRERIVALGAIVFWLLIWQLMSYIIGERLFLPSPVEVLARLFALVFHKDFWLSILFSLKRVGLGFLLAFISAFLFALLSYLSKSIEILLSPLVKAIRAVPVASIVILTLVWVSSRNLSVVISFMIVFPVIYTSVLEGLKNTPVEILEMCSIYHIKGFRRVRYIYLPYLIPYLEQSLKTALGLAWKSAIAAEVIGLPDGSIGEKLYNAKVFFSTPDLFAWTVVIVLLATSFEHLILYVARVGFRRLER